MAPTRLGQHDSWHGSNVFCIKRRRSCLPCGRLFHGIVEPRDGPPHPGSPPVTSEENQPRQHPLCDELSRRPVLRHDQRRLRGHASRPASTSRSESRSTRRGTSSSATPRAASRTPERSPNIRRRAIRRYGRSNKASTIRFISPPTPPATCIARISSGTRLPSTLRARRSRRARSPTACSFRSSCSSTRTTTCTLQTRPAMDRSPSIHPAALHLRERSRPA